MKVTDAVNLAINYAADLPKLKGGKKPTLEEVEFEEPYWLVTLGFMDEVKSDGISAVLRGQEYLREKSFKTFKVDPSGDDGNGSVISMKIRSVELNG